VVPNRPTTFINNSDRLEVMVKNCIGIFSRDTQWIKMCLTVNFDLTGVEGWSNAEAKNMVEHTHFLHVKIKIDPCRFLYIAGGRANMEVI